MVVELEMLKGIPGYSMILKAVLKTQIQLLLDQLCEHGEEDVVVLTASVSDGSLTHMGSQSGKNFLKQHEEIKSQFLGFCIKANLGHSNPDAIARSHVNSQYPAPPSETNVNITGGSRNSTSVPNSLKSQNQNNRSAKKLKTHHNVHEQECLSFGSESHGNSFCNPSSQKETASEEHASAAGTLGDNRMETSTSDHTQRSDINGKQDNVSHGIEALTAETESRSKARKNSRPVKNIQETERGPEIIKLESDGVVVIKREPQESENETEVNDDSYTGYDFNWSHGIHRVGSETYLSKPSYETVPHHDEDSLASELSNYIDSLNDIQADVALHEDAKTEDFTTSKDVSNNESDIRFPSVCITPQEFIDANENKYTKKKTIFHKNLFESFLRQKNDEREIHQIEPTELNHYLCEFLLRVRQKNGEEYEPVSLRSIVSSLDRYLKQRDYPVGIVRGVEFRRAMDVLAKKGKELKKQGKGSKPMASQPLSSTEIELLYKNEQLGNNTPDSLLNTLWLNNTLHFGMRGGGNEQRQLAWGDIELGYDTVLKQEYLEFNERQSKVKLGSDISNHGPENPRLYATQDERCPVVTYKIYQSKRPKDYCGPKDPFYLATNLVCEKTGLNQAWFLRGPAGKNKLNTLMKRMAEKASLPDLEHGKRITNISVRKTVCQKTSRTPYT